MPFIQARARFTNGNGQVVTDASNNLNVNKVIPLNEWMIRVEWCPVGSTVITNRANYEIAESIKIPHNAYVNVYPILRSEKDLTQTEAGLHLASFRFDDALINGRSIKTIGTNEIVGTWKFAPRNVLNILSLYTDAEPYGSSALNVIFKQFYGSDIACTIIKEGPPVIVSPETAGYYTTQTGGSVYNSFGSTATRYLRFKLGPIKAGTVLTLRAGPHSTPGSHYYTDFTVIQANGAIDSSNGVKTRMYGDGVPNKTITLTFTKDVLNPVEFIIGVNIYNVIYTMDRYGASCNNYVDANGVNILAQYASLHW